MTVELLGQVAVAEQQVRQPPVAWPPAASLPLFSSVPPLLLFVLMGVSVLAPGPIERAALPLAVAGGLAGLPHGAVDHLVLGWSAPVRRNPSALAVLTIGLGYAALAVAAAAALILFPAVSLAIALVLAAVHFGRGEVAAWAERSGAAVPSPTTDALPAIAHGAAVVGLLLWVRPSTSSGVLAALSPRLCADIQSLRAVGLCTVAAAVIAGVGRLLASLRYRDAFELTLVAMTFVVVAPLAAFGIYFGGWHALRHSARLLDLARTPEDGGWMPSVRRLSVAGALPTLLAVGALVLLWDIRAVAGLATEIAVLLALTVPHAIVVATMDRARGRPSALR